MHGTHGQDLPPTLTVEEAGELLGISRGSAYRAAASGELSTLRLGRRLLVPTARLLDLLGMPTDGARIAALVAERGEGAGLVRAGAR